MKAIIAGAGGQLGQELLARAPSGVETIPLTAQALDIGDAAAVEQAFRRIRPQLVINAAAYTAEDRAESEAELAFRVNRDGAANLAAAAARTGARLVHVSTDFVFDGRASTPYRPEDATGPLGVYGASKLAGEGAVASAAPGSLIVRTAWVYSPLGRNFLKTMLRLMGERGSVSVVSDQFGAPTSAANLATTLWAMTQSQASGLHHYTDAGAATWYDFAQAIAEEGMRLGLIPAGVEVRPIRTVDYPAPARRPAFSVLDTSSTAEIIGRTAPHWRVALREVLGRVRDLSRTTA